MKFIGESVDDQGIVAPLYQDDDGRYFRQNPPKDTLPTIFKAFGRDRKAEYDAGKKEKDPKARGWVDASHIALFDPSQKVIDKVEAIATKAEEDYVKDGGSLSDTKACDLRIKTQFPSWAKKPTFTFDTAKIEVDLKSISKILRSVKKKVADHFILMTENKKSFLSIPNVGNYEFDEGLVKQLSELDIKKIKGDLNNKFTMYNLEYFKILLKVIDECSTLFESPVKSIDILYATDYPMTIKAPGVGDFMLAPRIEGD